MLKVSTLHFAFINENKVLVAYCYLLTLVRPRYIKSRTWEHDPYMNWSKLMPYCRQWEIQAHFSVHAMIRMFILEEGPLSESEYYQLASLDQALGFLLRPCSCLFVHKSCGRQPLQSSRRDLRLRSPAHWLALLFARSFKRNFHGHEKKLRT